MRPCGCGGVVEKAMDSMTPPGAKIRVLIADDVSCMRESLRTVLSLDPSLEIVGEAADGAETVKLAAHLRPDVVLVDLEMPCYDGYVCTQELTERSLCKAVVVLSIHSDSASRARARAVGATLFLPKGTPIAPLVRAIQRAAGRDLPAPSARFARLRDPLSRGGAPSHSAAPSHPVPPTALGGAAPGTLGSAPPIPKH